MTAKIHPDCPGQLASLIRCFVRRLARSPADNTSAQEAARGLRRRGRVPAHGFHLVRQLLSKGLGGRRRPQAVYEWVD